MGNGVDLVIDGATFVDVGPCHRLSFSTVAASRFRDVSDLHLQTAVSLDEVASRIDQAFRADQRRLRNGLSGIRRRAKQGQPYDRSLAKLVRDLEQSEKRKRIRVERLPQIAYDDALPIVAKRDDIARAILDHQVIIVCGETGSGKSTQLPKICLELGRGIDGVIGHTQPRRIAARSVAARVAEELGSSLGQAVGFKVRFTDTTRPHTYIKLMTDGILLAETQSDRWLEQYDTLIIDEAHERSLNIDFLLGYIKRTLPRRPELRVIITSATIDAARFAAFFSAVRPASPGDPNRPAEVGERPQSNAQNLAPVIEVSGRTYPVEVRYRPPVVDETEDEVDWQRAAADACVELASEGEGDILVFMPTERDIRETARVLHGREFLGANPEILPLFGRLSEKEQNRVFRPHSGRRIVIATNVAESSLTVPGIRFVVDPGTARISRFSSGSQVQRLPIEPISQASGNQRKGRCGRIGPGVCVRLYSEADFLSRDEYTQPEVLRTNLAAVLLQMKALNLGKLEEFPFLDSPNPSAIRSGLKTLFELGALDADENLTGIGRAMSKLPVDPRIARMILAAADEQCLEEVLVIAAALELRDPRDRPLDRQQAADEAHRKFRHENSDFLSLLKLWDFYDALDEKLSHSKLRKACQQNFLSFNRMREWRDLRRQLREIATERDLQPTDRRNDEDAIHRAILTGLLANVAFRGEGHEYTGSGGQKLFLWPGSVTFAGKPKWIMAAELVETTRRFARVVAPVRPEWIERIADHLIKRTYSEPHWHERSQAVMAYEKLLLSGMPIVPRRRCRYGHIEPRLARELFIQHALVERELRTPGEFFKHNARLAEELTAWQAKLRQGSHFIGEDAEFRFYDERIPPDVWDGPRFEKWRKQAEARHPRMLFQSREDFLVNAEDAPRPNAFPDHIRIGTMKLPVEYTLEPGSAHDGVTLVVPREGLNQLSHENLAWLVPGLLEEKVAALIKTIPKQLRILFVPIPQTAHELVRRLDFGRGNLLEQLSEGLREISNEHVPVEAFELDRLPPHLRFNVRVVDPQGKPLAKGRDLRELRTNCAQQTQKTITQFEDHRWNRDGLTDWDFGELPEQITLQRGGITVIGFPMLVDRNDTVELRLAESKQVADWRTKQALVRFFLLSETRSLHEQISHLPGINHLMVQAQSLPDGKSFRDELTSLLARAALGDDSVPRDAAQWKARAKQARQQISIAVQDLAALIPQLLEGYHAVRRLLERPHAPALSPLVADIQEQFAALIAPGFLTRTPFPWLKQYPRYFQAIQMRWDKATTGGFHKDRRNQQQVAPHWARWRDAERKLGEFAPANSWLVHYRWMIEEYRVSLFAQQIRTAIPVSEKRLNEAWARVT